MTYDIQKEIKIRHTTDDWEYSFTADEYGTVCIFYTEGMEAMTGETKTIHIPKDCIQNFIDVLEQFK
jgi:hypothetical protein